MMEDLHIIQDFFSKPCSCSKQDPQDVFRKLVRETVSKLCKRGKEYIKDRQSKGEKSSAYLSGRAVKVCKGQIKFKGKKLNSFK